MTRISTACSWVSIGSPEKAAILAQVGQIYFGAVGQFYIGANILAFVRSAHEYIELPDGTAQPKRSDFTQWAELIADWAAPGAHSKDIRSHLKQVSNSAWQLANWLTHTHNALRIDAELTMDATHHVLEVFSTAVVRKESARPDRCPECGSYQLRSFYAPELDLEPPYVTVCQACEWESVDVEDEAVP